MSEIMIINASPRKKGTSNMFCNRCKEFLGGELYELYTNQDIQWLIPQVGKADIILIAGPCYINTYPAEVIRLLEKLGEHPEVCHNQKVYGIINGGMPYVHTHESGLNMLSIFCQECNMTYQGGFVLGLGPTLDGKPLEKHMNAKKVVPAFEQFLEHIQKGEQSPDQLYHDAEMKVPSLLARFMVHTMIKRLDKNLKTFGFEYNDPSPYWNEK
jgi:NADPH-dependent FMN reductase.